MSIVAQEVFDLEIGELQKVKENIGKEFDDAVNLIYKCKGKVIIAGIGKSGIIGHKISASLSSTGTHSVFMNAAEGLHGDLGMINKEDIVLIISNSGNSPEIIQMIPSIKKIGAKMIAMTGNLESKLAKESNITLNIEVEREACPLNLAPTASTTATLLMGDALTVALIKKREFKRENFAVYHPGGALGRKLLTNVVDVMHKNENIPVVYPEDTIEKIIYEISNKRLGMVCVLKEKKIIGIITDGDIRRKILHRKERILEVTAQEIMTSKFISITSSQQAVEALKLMEERGSKINCLPVIDNEGLVGVITLHDLLDFKS